MESKIKQFRRAKLTIMLMVLTLMSTAILAQDVHITQNTTWSTNQNPTGNIFVENGATLTILSGVIVKMPVYSYIVVGVESKLIANGVVFTGISTSSPFGGIFANGYGNSIDQIYFLNPGNEKQPELIFTNCTFSFMQLGINNTNTIHPSIPNDHTGGILKIENCIFNNSTESIRFYGYLHYRQSSLIARDVSYIRNCTFNSNSRGIKLDKYSIGVRIEGNTFNNCFVAIDGYSATFSVKDYYSGPFYNATFVSSTVFNNCRVGVRVSGSDAIGGKCTIRDAEFIDSEISISAYNSDNIEIYSNTISIQQNINNYNRVGIYLENCATFNVEDNALSAMGYNGYFPTNTWGIVAHNCGENNNRIYNNTVSNCEYNIVGQEHNRGAVNQSGLQFICNDLSQSSAIGTDNTYYMAALTTQPNNPLHGINDWQAGGAYNSSLNQYEFSSSAYNEIPQRALASGDKYDFYNEHIRLPFDIHYKNPRFKLPTSQVLESNTSNPTYDYYGDYIWVIDESSTYTNKCPSTVSSQFPTPTTLSNISAQLQAVVVPYGPLKTTFAGYENNGDHQFMLNQVNGMDNTNYTIVYYYLMNYHPSTDVIAIAVGNDIMPNYMCADVLTTNSYGIKSQLVRDALAGRQNQLTSAQMASIKTAAQTQSQYESYLLELASLRTQINTLSTAKYNYYFNSDSVEVDIEEVINTLVENENFYSYVNLMLYYFDIGKINLAEENYNQANNAEEISDMEKENLQMLYQILYKVYTDFEGDFHQLEQGEIDQLNRLSENESKSGGIAKSILMSEFKFKFEPILLKATQNSAKMAQIETKESNTMAEMRIMPNPASDFIGITITEDYEFPLQLNIYDISGKLVVQKHIENLNTIILDKLTTGLYQAVITDTNQKIFKQKLIIK